MLAETYSASTLAISGLIPCSDKSHDSILFALLSRSAEKIAHQPSVPRLLARRLRAREMAKGELCQRLLTLLCRVRMARKGDWRRTQGK